MDYRKFPFNSFCVAWSVHLSDWSLFFQDVSADCGINCMPTFHFYKKGQKVSWNAWKKNSSWFPVLHPAALLISHYRFISSLFYVFFGKAKLLYLRTFCFMYWDWGEMITIFSTGGSLGCYGFKCVSGILIPKSVGNFCLCSHNFSFLFLLWSHVNAIRMCKGNER